jgi:hypothetical protein
MRHIPPPPRTPPNKFGVSAGRKSDKSDWLIRLNTFQRVSTSLRHRIYSMADAQKPREILACMCRARTGLRAIGLYRNIEDFSIPLRSPYVRVVWSSRFQLSIHGGENENEIIRVLRARALRHRARRVRRADADRNAGTARANTGAADRNTGTADHNTGAADANRRVKRQRDSHRNCATSADQRTASAYTKPHS